MTTIATSTETDPTRPPRGVIAVFSDMACPFAHVAIHRIFETRRRLGLDDDVHIDHHAFPIELLNETPGTRIGSDSEIPVLGALEPDAGWQLWQRPDHEYPSTMLPALEAVAAAKDQSLKASEDLDRALRRAFWADSAPIHLHHQIIAIADSLENFDSAALEQTLRAGTHRSAIFDDLDVARTDRVSQSPHLFLPDGTNIANPGLAARWIGDWARGFPLVEHDDPSVYDMVLESAVYLP